MVADVAIVITADQLRRIMPYSAGRVDAFVEAFNAAMDEFEVNSARRAAAFIAQCAHESGELRYLSEIASGVAYEGRADLGNTQPGDGIRFHGRGLLMLTGRANYAHAEVSLNLPLLANPSLLEVPLGACRSAAWFWKQKGLNELADVNRFGAITKLINGGYTSLDARLQYYLIARDVLLH